MAASTKTLMRLYFSEFAGTFMLVSIGLSIVIFNWGQGSFTAHVLPSESLRRLLTGFLFGCTGLLITISPVGKVSGAHINPAVSLAFWLDRKMKLHAMFGYMAAQMLGAVAGALPLLLWGLQGKSIHYGNTVPGRAGIIPAFFGELLCTSLLVLLIFYFVGNKRLRDYTPFTMPFLYAFMVWAEAAFSGCSTNPARSFGPACISGDFRHFWIYLFAPLCGTLLVIGLWRLLRMHRYMRIEAARMSYQDHPSPQVLKQA